MKRLQFYYFLSLLILCLHAEAAASQCIYRQLSPEEKNDQAVLVFKGKVFAVEPLPTETVYFQSLGKRYQSRRYYATYYFVVSSMWKGTPQSIVAVKVEMFLGLCNLYLEQGEDYLVYAKAGIGGLETSLSGGTVRINDLGYREDIDYLNFLHVIPVNMPEIPIGAHPTMLRSITSLFVFFLSGLALIIFGRTFLKSKL